MLRTAFTVCLLALSHCLFGQGMESSTPTNTVSRFFWLGSGIFFLAFLVTLVWALRPKREEQIQAIGCNKLQREDAINELAILQKDYNAKRIPPDTYQTERQRILARAVNDQINVETTQEPQ